MNDHELELESEFEFENQGEGFLGGLLGEGEGEFEFEGEGEWETHAEGFLEGESSLHEFELEGEQFLGGLLGEGEFEGHPEGEFEGEQFFGKKLRGILSSVASGVRRAAPMLQKIASVAAPVLQKVVGGPLASRIASIGNIAGQVGNVANNLGSFLPKGFSLEGEGELEFEMEFESESEAEFESVMSGPLTEQQALGELMAAAASKAISDMEAESQIGAATVIALSPRDRRALRAVLASLNRGSAVLTKMLRRHRITAPYVRTVPTIVSRTALALKKQAAAGHPITRQTAGRAMAAQTRRVLGSPALCAKAVSRNVKATQAVSQRIRRTAPRSAYAG
jgi:lysozyme family protein